MKKLKQAAIRLPITRKDQLPQTGLHFVWLGQSGFLFIADGVLILVDAYLSNYLEHNHGDLPYAHERMIDAPISESLYSEIDLIVVSHGHEDHLDPFLIEQLGKVNKKGKFILPPGCRPLLQTCGIDSERIICISHENPFSDKEICTIEAFPAAHPLPEFDASRVWALSYRFLFKKNTVLFAGDTTVFSKWMEWAASKKSNISILPINGRDPEKEANGIVGNMNFQEALIVSLVLEAPLLGTHFGMFSFNTVNVDILRQEMHEFNLEEKADFTCVGILYSFT